MPRTPARERFERFVDRSAGPDGCHAWTGYLDKQGYARFSGPFGCSAARHALGFDGRPPPRGLHSRHTCDNRACVNARHLLVGTAADNRADMVSRGRHARHEGHWKAKLTWPQVRALRAAYASGVSDRVLAREYGLYRGTVWKIATGVLWPEDPMETATSTVRK